MAVDLPGSGENTTLPQEVTPKSYTDKVMAILEKVDSPVILVGHSMAGVVISQVAEYIPKKYKSLFMFLQLCCKMTKVFKRL
ncbi:alpha/beta fold hydrolase [Priestia megaterium]|nr:alpha/beta fold hydrolase [Priestia megaterium]